MILTKIFLTRKWILKNNKKIGFKYEKGLKNDFEKIVFLTKSFLTNKWILTKSGFKQNK